MNHDECSMTMQLGYRYECDQSATALETPVAESIPGYRGTGRHVVSRI